MKKCQWINPFCPEDRCVLPHNHPGTNENEHLLETMYGSAEPIQPECRQPFPREKK